MEKRNLYRSRTDRMIAGVCSGIAAYLEVDPTLVRLIAVLLLVVGNGVTFAVYVVMAIVVPEEPLGATVASASPWVPPVPESTHRHRGGVGLGFLLIVLGAAFLAARFVTGIAWWNLWPLVIVIAGLVQAVTPGGSGWSVHRFLDGLATVAVGVVLLGNMTGYISWSVWWTLLNLWPVLLISAGFSILGKGTHQDWLCVVGSLVVLVAFVYAGAVSWGGASGLPSTGAWIVGSGGTPYSFAEPGLGVTKARLDLKGGAGDIVIRGGSKLAEVSGESSNASPTISVSRSGDSANVAVSLGDSKQPMIVAPGIVGGRMDVALSQTALWDIALETGASSVNADLSSVRVNDLQLRTGVSSATVKLGDVPDGVKAVSVLVKAGVSSVKLLLPSAAEARVDTQNGLGATHVGGSFVKSGNQWETPGYSRAGKVYDIRIESGIGSVSVDTY